MNYHRGFLRLTLVISLIAGGLSSLIVASGHSPKEYGMREPTPHEQITALDWRDSKNKEFDPTSWLILNGSKIPKDNPQFAPYEYAVYCFIFPFVIGSGIVWLGYGVFRFLITGFHSIKEQHG